MANSNRGTRIPIRWGREEKARPGDPEAEPRIPSDTVDEAGAGDQMQAEEPAAVAEAEDEKGQFEAGEAVDWRDAALRLKAEMENYRKRQKRWAEDEVLREQEQFLRSFLGIADDLEQALKHISLSDPVHKGVQVVYDGVVSLLMRKGVERIAAEGQPFDPHCHEAVALVPSHEAGVPDMHVVAVTLPGYTFADRVLRPAKVIVAKQEG